MKKGLLLVFSILAFSASVKAQTLKTAVLVIGNGNSAWAAGLQAAVSGVKTIILTQKDQFEMIDPGLNLHSGIEAEFIKKMRKAKKITEGSSPVIIDQKTANEVIKSWADSTKNLTIIRNVNYVKLNHSGNNWLLKLNNGKTIKARILIHAGDDDLSVALNISKTTKAVSKPLNYKDNEYRTSIASGCYLQDRSTSASFVTLTDILPKEKENLVLANAGESMLIGQAAGATAAYAAFYDTKTSLVKLKEIQHELLKYKLALIPFADVSPDDVNWKAIQSIGVMGILKAEIKPGKALFFPDQSVSSLEIKQVLKELYYKAQIWFDDHINEAVNLDYTISLVCYLGNKSKGNTSVEIENKWKTSYHFSGDFDMKHLLSRTEFAAILNDYLQPVDVNIDHTGRVMK